MIYKYLSFSISIGFISFILGMTINSFLRKTEFYSTTLSNLNFIKSERLNKAIGIPIFKWVIKNTFFKFFNQKLKLNRKTKKSELHKLREEMTISEIDHLIGFGFVNIFALVKFYNHNILFGLTVILVNIVMNLYPSLLQQENKRRIDKLLKKL